MNKLTDPDYLVLFLFYVGIIGYYSYKWYEVIRDIHKIRNQPQFKPYSPQRFVSADMYACAVTLPICIGIWVYATYHYFF